ncbi:MAG: DNRLRE domain-containing protein [Arachnia sp.]
MTTVWRRATVGSLLLGFASMGLASSAIADPSSTDPIEAAIAEAVATNSAVEIAELTDEHSISVANPDGTVTLTVDREAVRVRDGGGFVDVDTTLVPKDGRLAPVAAAVDMDFSSGGDTALATVSSGSGELVLHAPFVLPAPSVDGDQLTYGDVLPGVDLVVSAHAEMFSEVLVVKDRTAALNSELDALDFRIETSGLSYSLAEDGSGQAVTSSGETVFRSTAPLIWDATPGSSGVPSTESPGESAALIETLASEGPAARGGGHAAGAQSVTLQLLPDAADLRGQDVVYPVYIDPSLGKAKNSFLVVRDTQSNYANTSDVLRVGYCNWTGCSPAYKARSYFDFDISQLKPRPDGSKATIKKASVTVEQTHAAGNAATAVILGKNTGSFSASADWPGPKGAEVDRASTSSGKVSVTFDDTDVAAYVQDLVDDKASKAGFHLRAATETDPYAWKKFENDPTLSITYGFPPGTPTAVGLASTSKLVCNGVVYASSGTPKLEAKALDNNLTTTKVKLAFRVYRKSNDAVVGTYYSDPVASNAVGTATPSPALAEGEYYLKVQATSVVTDGTALSSAWTSAYNFRVDLGAPLAPTVKSFTHPAGASYTDQRADGKLLVADTDPQVLGFNYSWNGVVPSTTSDRCTTNSTTGAVTGYAKATSGLATLTIPPSLANGAQAQLRVVAVSLNGQVSSVKDYAFKLNAAPVLVKTYEAEDLSPTGSASVTTDANASGGKKLMVVLSPGQPVTLTFTPPSKAGAPPGEELPWVVQSDITVPSGKAVAFQINGHVLGTPQGGDDTGFGPSCVPTAYTGTGSLAYYAVEPKGCDSADATAVTVPMAGGQVNMFTITAETSVTITIDRVRFAQNEYFA